MSEGPRVAVVIGAAHGIGAASADRLVAAGWRVLVVDLDGVPEEWEVAAVPVPDRIVADVTSSGAVEAVMTRAAEAGRLAGLVFAAALQHSAPLERSGDAWGRVLATNLAAPASCAELFATYAEEHGAIVLVSSIRARIAGATSAVYSASKAGVESLTRSLAVEFGPLGIRSNAVAPGFVAVTRNAAKWQEEDRARGLRRRNPLGILGSPWDIAEVVTFLLSPAARFVNGTVVAADGGELAGTSPYPPPVTGR